MIMNNKHSKWVTHNQLKHEIHFSYPYNHMILKKDEVIFL